jgi:hypothetical protein
MAGTPVVQAIGPSYHLPDRKQSVQRSVNLMLSRIEAPEANSLVLEQVPGWTSWEVFFQDVRGAYSTGDQVFIVSDTALLEYDADGALVANRGTLATSSGFVEMRHNGSYQLGIVDGGNYYILNLSTNVLTQITSGFNGSDFIDYLDGYFIFVTRDTEQFFISAIDDGASLAALDFSSADKQPDNVLTHRVFKGELYLFGRQSTEIWVNSGGADFPFVRYNATPIDVGIVGKRAVALTSDALFWVGQMRNGEAYVFSMSGYSPKRISNRSIELALQGLDLTECVVWSYSTAGSEIVAIEHPDLETTWCYDLATKEWHERARGTPDAWSPLGFSRVIGHGGTTLAVYGGVVLSLNRDTNKINADVMCRERVWPHLTAPGFEPINYRSLELGCSTGQGGNCYLRISNDGGYTWGPPLIKSLGAVGRWIERVRWHFLGSARDRVFRIGCSDDVLFNIHSATVDA